MTSMTSGLFGADIIISFVKDHIAKITPERIGPGGFASATRGGVAMRSWPLLLPTFGLSFLSLSFPSFAFDQLRGNSRV